MQLPLLFKTASFRLAAAYALLFGVSVAILAGVTYFAATSALDRQIRTRIFAESSALATEYHNGGFAQLMKAVHERQRGHLSGGLDYSVFGASGKRLYGTMKDLRFAPGWQTIYGPPDGDEAPGEMEHLSVHATLLSGKYWLFVGDDISRVRALGGVVLDTFGWVLALSLTLAIAGGLFLSSQFLARIEAINRTAEAIIDGDLRRRIGRRDAPDDLDRLASTLNRMLDRITNLMDALRHVSNDVAHDLRTPLGRLRHMLEETNRSAVTIPDFKASVARAIDETDGILDTFSAILRIAQVESGNRRKNFMPVALGALVEEICDTFQPSVEEAGKTLVTQVGGVPGIDGDRELLMQLLVNLLENAIIHSKPGATIAVSLDATRTGNELCVADDGPGVPDCERSNIFRRFYRLEQSRSSPGNGLGLSMVAAIAELHGAHLSAEDNRPGLRIRVSFPQAKPAHADVTEPTPAIALRHEPALPIQ